jgi:hypothetical protein
MDQDLKDYEVIYEKYMSTKLDTNFIQKWYKLKENSDPNNKAIFFKNFLLNSDEYKKSLIPNLKKMFELHFISPFKDEYVIQLMRDCKEDKVTNERIINFFKDWSLYKEMNATVITKFHNVLLKRPPSDQELNYYVNLFSSKNAVYSYIQLHQDLLQKHNIAEADDTIKSISEEYESLCGAKIKLKTLMKVIDTMLEPKKIVKYVLFEDNVFKNLLITELQESFQFYFNRDIHVLEFLKYYPEICKSFKENKQEINVDTFVESLSKIHANNYLQVMFIPKLHKL